MELAVMSLNLRGPDDPPPHDWPSRRPRLAALLARVEPDVVGTQEALAPMLEQLCADAPAERPLAWSGRDRLGGHEDEHCAVVYRSDRWRPVAGGDVALSASPDRLGTRWTATQGFPRMATWVRLASRGGTGEVVLVNTHLDHVCPQSRLLAARQLCGLVGEVAGDAPVVLTGDVNAEPGSQLAGVLAGCLEPVLPTAGRAPRTFHGYGTGSGCIDWVLARGVEVLGAEVLDDGPPVSDHHPVLATLRVPG
ncbi:endonuclease/exonuclease/phosphatase family protein [Phycicoccus endophyticus]|uniref:Endonuclease/exonuclease/phosphatase family protein n=1 Tax=Phycicoccus endophyticus TaxID=1690220 RepID=A0A7G9QY70_9MICO|nr:endonuclease/exonuclease/phosphatase family protein [Phycicoccus endophyticus]NHI19182.1 hypothetical protein [Phycicoccus endophyticus]QNN48295.1 endonuclease/exonuclease/phosphatase family protein [Phycicoccus endophyticus]GGL40822.1 endonuclease [Phycicoccus endophyticus]